MTTCDFFLPHVIAITIIIVIIIVIIFFIVINSILIISLHNNHQLVDIYYFVSYTDRHGVRIDS